MKLPETISVSEYISVINEMISGVEARVEGEISGLKFAASGHVYFNLKDENGVINCAIWRSIYKMCGANLEEGAKVIVSGNADIYPVRGSLTFKVRTVELSGEGALRKAYEELKQKLSLEGIFDNKRDVPDYPQKIGLITSLKGAAVHDFMSNLGKFGFKVLACDARVEGQEAVPDLLSALKRMKKENIDVLVVIRGGGSLQSLIAFDNETLTREIHNFPVPVVAGVGHHEDTTLVALAADVSQSTPTAAANILCKGFETANEEINTKKEEIKRRFDNLLYKEKKRTVKYLRTISLHFGEIIKSYGRAKQRIVQGVFATQSSIRHTKEKITNHKEGIKDLFRNALLDKKNQISHIDITSAFISDIRKEKERLNHVSRVISANDPKRQLRLGYSIASKEGSIVRTVDELKKGDNLKINFYNGAVNSQIKNVNRSK